MNNYLFLILFLFTCIAPSFGNGIDTLLIDLDTERNYKAIGVQESANHILIINFFYENKSLVSTLDTTSQFLLTIYFMPEFEENKTVLYRMKNKPKGLHTIDSFKDSFIKNVQSYFSNCKANVGRYNFKDQVTNYILKYNNRYYYSKGEFLTEFYYINSRGNLFANEYDYLTLDILATPFSDTDFRYLSQNSPYSVVEDNLFDRVFLSAPPNYKQNFYEFWVGLVSFHKSYISIKRRNKWYSADWVDESDYKFLYTPSLGIVGREFKKFFSVKSYLKINEKLKIESFFDI